MIYIKKSFTNKLRQCGEYMDYYIKKIEEKLFHVINLQYYNHELEDLKIFEQILKFEQIMTREELRKKKYIYLEYLPKIYEQQENEVCVAIHPNNKQFKDVYDGEDWSTIFYNYIRFNISLILSENVLCLQKYNLQYGDPGEIRIQNSISLRKYLVAIGYFDEIEYILEKSKTSNNRQIMFLEDLLSSTDISKYILDKRKNYFTIKKMLEEYGYNIPIVSPFTGKIIDDNPENTIKKVKELKKIYE